MTHVIRAHFSLALPTHNHTSGACSASCGSWRKHPSACSLAAPVTHDLLLTQACRKCIYHWLRHIPTSTHSCKKPFWTFGATAQLANKKKIQATTRSFSFHRYRWQVMRASFVSAVPMKGPASEMKQRDGGVVPTEMQMKLDMERYKLNRKAGR